MISLIVSDFQKISVSAPSILKHLLGSFNSPINSASMYSLFWQIYILILYPSSENLTIETTYHIMLFIVVVWHINVSSFCISLQIHSARTMRSESSSLLHFNIRQINEDGSEDATSLGRRQHCWEVFQVSAILFYF